jgi:hypothetical protein
VQGAPESASLTVPVEKLGDVRSAEELRSLQWGGVELGFGGGGVGAVVDVLVELVQDVGGQRLGRVSPTRPSITSTGFATTTGRRTSSSG